MKKKIKLILYTCEDCPKFSVIPPYGRYCLLADKEIKHETTDGDFPFDTSRGIIDWCPLENCEE